MSFLFKAVLGEGVVHPPAPKSVLGGAADTVNSAGGSQGTATVKTEDGFHGSDGYRASSPNVLAVASSLDDGRVIASRDFASLTRETQRKPPVSLPTDVEGGRTPPSDPRLRAVEPVQAATRESRTVKGRAPAQKRTDTRTLLVRTQTCVVVQDLRDALRELAERCPDLPYVTGTREVVQLAALLRIHADDEAVVSLVVQLLSGLTDVSAYPQYSDGTDDADDVGEASGSGAAHGTQRARRPGVYIVPEQEKRQVRDSFLNELVGEVPVLFEVLRQSSAATGSEGTQTDTDGCVSRSAAALPSPRLRFHCVSILLRLEEYRPSEVHRLVLECHGVSALVDLLSDVDKKDERLRDELLSLIASMTATDADLQTLIAFENGFEALFALVKSEGGVDGGAVVTECLSTIHNMLRGNASTQKLFLQMGCARHLLPLLQCIPARLAAVQSPLGALQQPSSPLFPAPTAVQSSIMLSSVGIVACLLREGDATDRDSARSTPAAVRVDLVQSGILRPLTRLALSGAAIDEATRIEALRALGSLMHQCKPALHEFLLPCGTAREVGGTAELLHGAVAGNKSGGGGAREQGSCVTTLTRKDSPQVVVAWSPLRAVMEELFTSGDPAMLGACATLMSVLLSGARQSPETELALTEEALSGFAPVAGVSGFLAANHVTVRASGAALALALTGPTPHPTGKFYAARILAAILPMSGVAESLMRARWTPHERRGPQEKAGSARGGAGGSAATPAQAVALPTIPSVTLSSALPATFLNALVSYLMFCLRGAHGSQHMDTAALGAYAFALLRWLHHTAPETGEALLRDPSWFPQLLQLAQGEGQVNVRLWCACLAADLCRYAGSCGPSGPLAEPGIDRSALVGMFVTRLGGAVTLDNLIFDVSTSTPQWSAPLADVFTVTATGTPVLYDMAFVNAIRGIQAEFKRICPAHASSSSPAAMGATANTTSSAPAEVRSMGDGCHGQGRQTGETGERGDRPAPAPLQDVANNSLRASQQGEQGNTLPQVLSDASLQAETESLRGHVESQQEMITSLQQENGRLREQLLDAETRLHDRTAAQSSDAARQGVWGAHEDAAVPHMRDEIEAQHATEMQELRDHLHLLEEALSAKEEEHQQLVQTLNTMESQLQQQQRLADCLQRENSRREPIWEAAPPPPPAPPAPRPVTRVAETQTEGNAEAEVATPSPPHPQAQELHLTPDHALRHDESQLHQLDVGIREEVCQLREQLDETIRDRDDLLILVAELNEECASMKAPSAMPSPPRKGTHSPEAFASRDALRQTQSNASMDVAASTAVREAVRTAHLATSCASSSTANGATLQAESRRLFCQVDADAEKAAAFHNRQRGARSSGWHDERDRETRHEPDSVGMHDIATASEGSCRIDPNQLSLDSFSTEAQLVVPAVPVDTRERPSGFEASPHPSSSPEQRRNTAHTRSVFAEEERNTQSFRIADGECGEEVTGATFGGDSVQCDATDDDFFGVDRRKEDDFRTDEAQLPSHTAGTTAPSNPFVQRQPYGQQHLHHLWHQHVPPTWGDRQTNGVAPDVECAAGPLEKGDRDGMGAADLPCSPPLSPSSAQLMAAGTAAAACLRGHVEGDTHMVNETLGTLDSAPRKNGTARANPFTDVAATGEAEEESALEAPRGDERVHASPPIRDMRRVSEDEDGDALFSAGPEAVDLPSATNPFSATIADGADAQFLDLR